MHYKCVLSVGGLPSTWAALCPVYRGLKRLPLGVLMSGLYVNHCGLRSRSLGVG